MAKNRAIVVDQKALKKLENAAQLKKAKKRIIRKGLIIIEKEQIKSYTITLRPNRPPGTIYRRTRKLQRSSEKSKVKKEAKGFSGFWTTDSSTTKYASLVLGNPNQQLPLHRATGWKDRKQVIKLTTPKINAMAEVEVQKEVSKI